MIDDIDPFSEILFGDRLELLLTFQDHETYIYCSDWTTVEGGKIQAIKGKNPKFLFVSKPCVVKRVRRLQLQDFRRNSR